jgi:hypothetical protein
MPQAGKGVCLEYDIPRVNISVVRAPGLYVGAGDSRPMPTGNSVGREGRLRLPYTCLSGQR